MNFDFFIFCTRKFENSKLGGAMCTPFYGNYREKICRQVDFLFSFSIYCTVSSYVSMVEWPIRSERMW